MDQNDIDRINSKIIDRLTDREVIYCVSMMIQKLAENQMEDDELSDIMEKLDYDVAVSDNDIDVYYDDAMEGWVYKNEDDEVSDVFDNFEQAAEAACEEFDIDPYEYTQEVLEHWIVSDFLAKKLEEHGEPVAFDLYGMDVWGRTCSNQSISQDGVMREIAEDMEILHGQRYSWE